MTAAILPCLMHGMNMKRTISPALADALRAFRRARIILLASGYGVTKAAAGQQTDERLANARAHRHELTRPDEGRDALGGDE